MTVTYCRPQSECMGITARPSYCGASWEDTLASARLTAEAWGRAFVLVTRSVPDRAAGGYVFVSSVPNPTWQGLPATLLAVIETD